MEALDRLKNSFVNDREELISTFAYVQKKEDGYIFRSNWNPALTFECASIAEMKRFVSSLNF